MFKFFVSKAFTLAEVLITIAIIGVVAAMTIPTLVSNINDRAMETQHKKAKTILANGYKLMMANEGGEFKIANLPFMTDCNKLEDVKCLSDAHKQVFKIAVDSAGGLDVNNLPEEYLITDSEEASPFKWTVPKYVFITNDGMVYGLLPNDDYTSVDIVTDVNNSKTPNVVKKDLYKFRLQAYGGALLDASDELLASVNNNVCSIDNREACTEDECYALWYSFFGTWAHGWDIHWTKEGKCQICYGTSNILENCY